MQITINADRSVVVSTKFAGNIGEHNAEVLHILLPVGIDGNPHIEIEADGTKYIDFLTASEGAADYALPNTVTGARQIYAQIIYTITGALDWKSNRFGLVLGQSINASEELEPSDPSAVATLAGLIGAAEGAITDTEAATESALTAADAAESAGGLAVTAAGQADTAAAAAISAAGAATTAAEGAASAAEAATTAAEGADTAAGAAISAGAYAQQQGDAITGQVGAHKAADVIDHPDGSVTGDKLADGAVSTQKLAFDAVAPDAAMLGGSASWNYSPYRGALLSPIGTAYAFGELAGLQDGIYYTSGAAMGLPDDECPAGLKFYMLKRSLPMMSEGGTVYIYSSYYCLADSKIISVINVPEDYESALPLPWQPSNAYYASAAMGGSALEASITAKIPATEKGAPDGVATLLGGKVPLTQIPLANFRAITVIDEDVSAASINGLTLMAHGGYYKLILKTTNTGTTTTNVRVHFNDVNTNASYNRLRLDSNTNVIISGDNSIALIPAGSMVLLTAEISIVNSKICAIYEGCTYNADGTIYSKISSRIISIYTAADVTSVRFLTPFATGNSIEVRNY